MVHPPIDSAPLTTLAEGWSLAAITAGFVATIGMTVVLLAAIWSFGRSATPTLVPLGCGSGL